MPFAYPVVVGLLESMVQVFQKGGSSMAVLTAAGASLKPSVRTLADAAAAEAASSAVIAATQPPSSPAAVEASSAASVAVRRAAYDALLASVLAPRPFRPTNLALTSALFRRARLADPALASVAVSLAVTIWRRAIASRRTGERPHVVRLGPLAAQAVAVGSRGALAHSPPGRCGVRRGRRGRRSWWRRRWSRSW